MLIIPFTAKFYNIIEIFDYNNQKNNYWIIDYHLEYSKILIKGRPVSGIGEAIGDFSLSLKELEKKVEYYFQPCSPDELKKCHLKVFVGDIFTTLRGIHLGSFIFMEFLNFIKYTIYYSGKATITGNLGARNERTAENIRRRENFWNSFGIEVDYENNVIKGDLKKVLDYRKNIWNIKKISSEKICNIIQKNNLPFSQNNF